METIKLPEPVIVEPIPIAKPKSTTDTKAVAEPKTTAEEDRKTQGQRNTNLIWEATQSMLAMVVTGALVYTSVNGIDAPHLSTAFTSIILLYFVRTNHTKTGGVGGTDSR